MNTDRRHSVPWSHLLLLAVFLVGCEPGWTAVPPTATGVVAPQESATYTATPGARGTPSPATAWPTLVAQTSAAARIGPGAEYETSHIVFTGTVAPIVGRNAGSTWWAVPGPSDGSSAVVWIADAVVDIQGDTSHVPVLYAPPSRPTPTAGVPVVGNVGTSPAGRCIVSRPATHTDPTYVYAAPGEQSPVLGQIGPGRWSEALEAADGWYNIPLSPTERGWVRASDVAEGELCPGALPPAPPTPWPELSIVGHVGLPPADLCAVLHPGPGPAPVNIYSGLGAQYAVVAWLGTGRWAEVLESSLGWHRVQIGAGETGWMDGEQVILSGPCATASVPAPDGPVVLDPGAPPTNACVASYPGPAVPPVAVHLGPGEQYAVVARLGNWAEVLKSSMGWHQILIGPGMTGWVDGRRVILSGPCKLTPTP